MSALRWDDSLDQCKYCLVLGCMVDVSHENETANVSRKKTVSSTNLNLLLLHIINCTCI